MGRYLIRVEGLLSPALTSAFPSLHASEHAQTMLAGSLEDQSYLAGMLKRLEDLGIDVVGVHRLPDRRPQALPPRARLSAKVG